MTQNKFTEGLVALLLKLFTVSHFSKLFIFVDKVNRVFQDNSRGVLKLGNRELLTVCDFIGSVTRIPVANEKLTTGVSSEMKS